MSKKFISLLLVCIMLAAICGCARKTDTNTAEGTDTVTVSEEAKKLGYSSWSSDIYSLATPSPEAMRALLCESDGASEDVTVIDNLLGEADSTFETATEKNIKWKKFSTGTLSIENTEKHGKALYYRDYENNYSCPAINLCGYVKEAGDYRFYFEFKLDESSSGTSFFKCAIRGNNKSDATSFIEKNQSGNYMLTASLVFDELEDDWYSAYLDFTVEEGDIDGKTHTWNFCLHHMPEEIKGFYIDNVQFGKITTTKNNSKTEEKFVTNAETWVSNEITLISDKDYSEPLTDALLDIVLVNGDTKLTVPGFWDGDRTWKIRFALTKVGEWTYETVCSDSSNAGLNGKKGTINCTAYSGDLDIYKHGFVTTQENTKYFVYADGTPFFYLGDTHWNYLTEEFDSAGTRNVNVNTTSHFKYIVNKRVAQGYTVYQTEPIGAKFDAVNGIGQNDISGFQDADRYYKYIADMGMVHANAELFYASSMARFCAKSNYEAELEAVCRYWVARFGSYPVMWTLAQEIDNEWYYINTQSGGVGKNYDGEYPYILMARYLAKYDAYNHPLSGHQQGVGIKADSLAQKATVASVSSFRNEACHTWWASQWKPKMEAQFDFAVPKDYWENGQGKPSVVYEGCYDHLWTNEWGARAQGWLAFVNGMYGYGYGCEDMWLYQSTYDVNKPTTRNGITVTVEDKAILWGDSIELPAGYQMGYMRKLLEKLEWWNLVPRFDDKTYFTVKGEARYSVASIRENETYVLYFYDQKTTDTGVIMNLKQDSEYVYQWFNPRTAAMSEPQTVNKAGSTFDIGARPTQDDWVLIVTRV